MGKILKLATTKFTTKAVTGFCVIFVPFMSFLQRFCVDLTLAFMVMWPSKTSSNDKPRHVIYIWFFDPTPVTFFGVVFSFMLIADIFLSTPPSFDLSPVAPGSVGLQHGSQYRCARERKCRWILCRHRLPWSQQPGGSWLHARCA